MGAPLAPLIGLLACAILTLTRPAGSTRPTRMLGDIHQVHYPACNAACYSVLGAAGRFTVLAGTSVSIQDYTPQNDKLHIGVSPGKTLSGFTPGQVFLHAADKLANAAQADAKSAYKKLTALPATHALETLPWRVTPGVYSVSSTTPLSGVLNLDAQNDPSALFVFKFSSAFTTAQGFNMYLINQAQACNVFFVVGTAATVNAGSIVGTLIATDSITLNPYVTSQGSLIALNGAVSMQISITGGPCVVPYPSPPPLPAPCNGYTFLFGVDSSGPQIMSTYTGAASAAGYCTNDARCLSFDTNFQGFSVLRATSVYTANPGQVTAGLFIKTCDATASGYAAVSAWDWGGTVVDSQDHTCADVSCCSSTCRANINCDVFMFDTSTQQCVWETKPLYMTAGRKAAITTTSYMKLGSLPEGVMAM